MTTPNEFRGLIYSTFQAEWGSLTPFTFDNEQWDPPDGIPWVRLVVRNGTRRQKTLGRVGNRKFEREARVILSIFTLPNTGQVLADELSQVFLNLFEGADLGVNVLAGETDYRERGTAEGWAMAEASADFTYDETR